METNINFFNRYLCINIYIWVIGIWIFETNFWTWSMCRRIQACIHYVCIYNLPDYKTWSGWHLFTHLYYYSILVTTFVQAINLMRTIHGRLLKGQSRSIADASNFLHEERKTVEWFKGIYYLKSLNKTRTG